MTSINDINDLKIDDPVYVSNDGITWRKEHFAKYENGKIYTWHNGGTSWSRLTMDLWLYYKLCNYIKNGSED